MIKYNNINLFIFITIIIVVFIILIICIIYNRNKNKNKIKNKIINTHWYGRFGNRMFTYAFGCCYAKKYNCKYYYLSEWEGNKLFINNKYSEPLENLDKQLSQDLINDSGDTEKVKESINKYNKRSGDNLEFIDMNNNNIGKTNIAYNDFNIMYDMFDVYDKDFLKNEIFVFNNDVKNTEIYKNLQKVKNKYFVAHIRMGDICNVDYKGHIVV